MMRFTNKTILITGGRSGIGQATARRFRDEGATVLTAQRQADPECDHIKADLSNPSSASMIIDHVIEKTGRLDVLVNNAGIMLEGGVDTMALDDWMLTLNINLTAPFLLIKAALPFLIKSGGSIVNVGSIEGLGANPNHAAYAASKAGLHGLTKAVAVDHGPDGVRCNAVAPGWIDTDLNHEFINTMPDPDAFRRDIGSIHPVGRTGTPEEVAGLITFLASEDASFITGQIYTADGGRMTKLSLP